MTNVYNVLNINQENNCMCYANYKSSRENNFNVADVMWMQSQIWEFFLSQMRHRDALHMTWHTFTFQPFSSAIVRIICSTYHITHLYIFLHFIINIIRNQMFNSYSFVNMIVRSCMMSCIRLTLWSSNQPLLGSCTHGWSSYTRIHISLLYKHDPSLILCRIWYCLLSAAFVWTLLRLNIRMHKNHGYHW